MGNAAALGRVPAPGPVRGPCGSQSGEMVSPSAVAAGDELWSSWPMHANPDRTGPWRVRRVEVLEVRPDGRVLARYDDGSPSLSGESTVRRWRWHRPAGAAG